MMSSISLTATFALLAGIAGCVAWPSAATAESASPKSILVLHTYGQQQSMFRPVFDRALQQALNRRGMGDAEVYVETLESNRFPGDSHAALFQYYLRQKYANQKIDAVIAVWDRALSYMLTHRNQLFPDAPIAALVARPRQLGPDSQVAQVTTSDRALATARLALTFHPATRQIFVIDGTLQSNDDVQQQFTDELKPLASRISVEFLRDLPLTELLERVKRVPGDSVLLFVRQTMRSRTQSMPQRDALEHVAHAARVPVYVASDQLVGLGAIGGAVFKTEAMAEMVADSATELIAGTAAKEIALRETPAVATVDWRQLRKWNIAESLLPAGTDIQFREYPFWQQNQTYIVGVLTVFMIQAGLIAGLLLQRSRRRRAEGALRDNEHALQVSQEDTRRLAGRLIAAQEIERARIARELHDDLSQKVALLAIDINQIALSDAPGVRARANIMAERAAEIATDLHNLSYELHPAKLQILGLVPATQLLCRDLAAHHRVSIDFVHDRVSSNVPPEPALCLFRIAQEALQNVVKHSGARNASVRLTGSAGSLQLDISDPGSGFDMSKLGDGMGLLSMRERVNFLGGGITIWSKPGMGTRITVQIPVPQVDATDTHASARIA
jgi:signal transduction histidine kinase